MRVVQTFIQQSLAVLSIAYLCLLGIFNITKQPLPFNFISGRLNSDQKCSRYVVIDHLLWRKKIYIGISNTPTPTWGSDQGTEIKTLSPEIVLIFLDQRGGERYHSVLSTGKTPPTAQIISQIKAATTSARHYTKIFSLIFF